MQFSKIFSSLMGFTVLATALPIISENGCEEVEAPSAHANGEIGLVGRTCAILKRVEAIPKVNGCEEMDAPAAYEAGETGIEKKKRTCKK
ncbi:hypothetical protein BOTCAL_0040g00230 [Botryotinia calthae]|uniref:Uncharacterized protein n=1 Tax=Botryotinia calthae TaxID=38488 RepID=A0A4Y8DET2_9HELO|nr:hypothetical protein BOTCAL_0040g00230 [Botryotinia calthae]